MPGPPPVLGELGLLPFFGHTIDGNQNGRTGIRQQLALIEKDAVDSDIHNASIAGRFGRTFVQAARREVARHLMCRGPT